MAIAEFPNGIELQHVDRGETKEQVLFGAKRATAFIKETLRSSDKFDRFNAKLIDEIHDRVAMAPGVKGFIRETNTTSVGGERVRGSYTELPFKMRKFSDWLQEQMQQVKEHPEDIILALKTAAAAHYGLTSKDFHPYDNGNGRTARALSNAILMSQAYELTAFGHTISPVPIVRDHLGDMQYIKVLLNVEESQTLNPLMAFMSNLWRKNVQEIIHRLAPEVSNSKNPADKRLLEKLQLRVAKLTNFIKNGEPSTDEKSQTNYQEFPVPDYFAPNLVRFDHA